MAAQYDVNLEKCALLKCLCGSAFAAGQAPVRSLALKISVILGHTDKSSLIHLSNLWRLYVYLCALRITTKRCAFKQTGCALGLMWTWEFTPVSPSASNLCVCLKLLWNYHIRRDVLTWMQLWSRRVCFRENLFLRSFPMETVNSSSRPLM